MPVCAGRIHGQLRHRGIVENPLAVGFLLPLFQDFRCAGRQENGSCAGFCFGFSHPDAAALSVAHRAVDMEPAGLVIKVLPLETADFSPAHSCGQLRVEEVIPQRILLQRFHEFFQLLLRQNLLGRVIHFGNDGSFGGIFRDQPLPHRHVQRLMEHHVNAADKGVRQGVPLLKMLVHPPVLPEPVVHFLDVGGGDGADLFVPQQGLDVVLRYAFIAVQGALPDGQGHVICQPFIQPLPQRHTGFFRQLHVPIFLHPAVEFFQKFPLSFCEHRAEDGAAIRLVSHHNSALPASVAALAHQSVTCGSSFCHVHPSPVSAHNTTTETWR